MSYKLYINGQLCDPPEEGDVLGAFGINNLVELATRQGFASNVINLPFTNNNKLIMGNAQHLLSASFIPYEQMSAWIDDENDNRIVTGSAILLSAKDVFAVNVVAGNADWFAKVKDKTLEELVDLVELNHFWTEANVMANRLNVFTDGFLYPNIDYGKWKDLTSTDVPYSDFYAAVYQKYLFKKIFEALGFTITGDWYSGDTHFNPQILPFSATWKRDKRYEHRWYSKITSDGAGFTMSGSGGFLVNPVLLDSSNYNHIPIDGFDARWIILDPIKITYRLTGTTTNFDSVTNEGRIRFFKYERNSTTTPIPAAVDVVTFNVAPGTNPIDITFQLDGEFIYMFQAFSPDSNNMNIDSGSIIEAISYEEYNVDNINEYLKIIPESECVFTDTYNYISLSGTLPNVKVADYIRTIVNKYYLLYDTKINTALIDFFTLQDVKDNTPIAEDWSELWDESEDPEIVFKPEGYFKNNILKYASDDSDELLVANPDFGKGQIIINNDQLEEEGVVFESVFAPVLRRQSFLGCVPELRMAYIPKFIDGNENQCTHRMATVAFDGDHNLVISGNPLEPIQPAVYFNETFNLDLIPVYYPALEGIMYKFKMATPLLKLTKAHVANLNYKKPKWIAGLGCYFYLNDIPQFNFSKVDSTYTQLIKI